MLSNQVKKEVEALNALTSGLLAINNAALEVLYTLRRNQGKCIECGKPREEGNEELCDKCWNAWITQKMDETKHPDDK